MSQPLDKIDELLFGGELWVRKKHVIREKRIADTCLARIAEIIEIQESLGGESVLLDDCKDTMELVEAIRFVYS